MRIFVAALIAGLFPSANAQAEWDRRGDISVQVQAFAHDDPLRANSFGLTLPEPQNGAEPDGVHRSNLSLSVESEFFHTIGENGSITITPFVRVDQRDDERTHFDFRELLFGYVADSYELKVGLGKVFWGVAESVNLVDVVNQSDSVEGAGSDDKLGQPMINLLLNGDWGDLELYLLPGFRERTFAGVDGRPRPALFADTDAAVYESSAEESHVDVAMRYVRVLGSWDVGLHAFQGTARDPLLLPVATPVPPPDSGENVNDQAPTVIVDRVQPFYYQVSQVGIDAQATLESWLLKTELVHRSGGSFENHVAAVTGFEYSFYDIKATGADLGIVAEYLYDERGKLGDSVFQNDVLIGLRFALNDAESTDALLGVITDLDGYGSILSLEASRRFGSSFKGTFTYTGWSVSDPESPLLAFDREDNVEIELGYFF